jgi:hypothetical protein
MCADNGKPLCGRARLLLDLADAQRALERIVAVCLRSLMAIFLGGRNAEHSRASKPGPSTCEA